MAVLLPQNVSDERPPLSGVRAHVDQLHRFAAVDDAVVEGLHGVAGLDGALRRSSAANGRSTLHVLLKSERVYCAPNSVGSGKDKKGYGRIRRNSQKVKRYANILWSWLGLSDR